MREPISREIQSRAPLGVENILAQLLWQLEQTNTAVARSMIIVREPLTFPSGWSRGGWDTFLPDPTSIPSDKCS